jgi:putative acetyltransferase
MDEICVLPVDPTSAPAVELIAALDRYLTALYPPDSNHLAAPAALAQPGAVFLGAFLGERLVGCCGYIRRTGGYAELKRLFVNPEARGRGIGERLLAALEEQARSDGIPMLRGESGVHQPAALRVCERAGFVRCGPFGDYPADPLSVFMEKQLGPVLAKASGQAK